MYMKYKKKLVLLRGLPGSGKTTIAKWLESVIDPSLTTAVLAADDFFTDEHGNYNFDISKISQAHNKCKELCEHHMEYDTNVIIVHNTFTTKKELTPYLDLADYYKYQVFSIIVENRHGNKDIHNVPELTIDAMRERFSFLL